MPSEEMLFSDIETTAESKKWKAYESPGGLPSLLEYSLQINDGTTSYSSYTKLLTTLASTESESGENRLESGIEYENYDNNSTM